MYTKSCLSVWAVLICQAIQLHSRMLEYCTHNVGCFFFSIELFDVTCVQEDFYSMAPLI